jgi:hypothetical protein
MMMRMVLVGLVAALGLTNPTPIQCSQWWSSIRFVGAAALADWDHWHPQATGDERAVYRLQAFVPRRQAGSDRARLAEGKPPSSPIRHAPAEHLVDRQCLKDGNAAGAIGRRESDSLPDLPKEVFENPTLVFEPLTIPEAETGGVAYELNRMAEGIGIKLADLPEVSKKRSSATDLELVPFGRSDDLAAWLLAGMLTAPKPVVAAEQKAALTCDLHRPSAALDCVELPGCGFDTDDEPGDLARTAAVAIAAVPDSPSDAGENSWLPAIDFDASPDYCENRSTLSWREATASAGPPLERNDGPSLGSDRSGRISHPQPDISADLQRAMVLTRDAFEAWLTFVRNGSPIEITKR